MFLAKNVLKLFVEKYNIASHKNSFFFSIPFNFYLHEFISKFLIPKRIILHLKQDNNNLLVYLPRNQNFCFFFSVPNHRKTFFSCKNNYLFHINKSSLPLVRDFYIIQTNKGLLSFEDSLNNRKGGKLFLSIFFYDKRQLKEFK